MKQGVTNRGLIISRAELSNDDDESIRNQVALHEALGRKLYCAIIVNFSTIIDNLREEQTFRITPNDSVGCTGWWPGKDLPKQANIINEIIIEVTAITYVEVCNFSFCPS